MTGTGTALTLARAQFAFSIGLASFLAVLEALWLKTGKPVYDNWYRYWVKIFAIVCGMGVVSGIPVDPRIDDQLVEIRCTVPTGRKNPGNMAGCTARSKSRSTTSSPAMDNPLLRKLANFTPLSDEESKAVDECCKDVRAVGAREDVISQGDRTGGVKLLLEGFACRYKTLEDGRRQIVAYFVPGDLCDLRVFILKRMDHSIGAIAPSRVATIAPDNVLKLMHNYPTLTRALWWSTLVEEAIAREWIVNVGQRNALERMAHLFCELLYRFRAVGLNEDMSCTLPLTQVELAETLGLSSVHVNRTLQELRRQKLITLDNGTLTIQNLRTLEDLSFFNAEYLHLDYRAEHSRDVEREGV